MDQNLIGEILYKLGAIDKNVDNLSSHLNRIEQTMTRELEDVKKRVSKLEQWSEAWKVRVGTVAAIAGVITSLFGNIFVKITSGIGI